jgi:Fe-S cluster biogenesis protein NfuA/nitrite reductase/ring-hydroxylating ferredoxin subunit
MHDNKAFQKRLERVEVLINQIQATANPATWARAEELLQTVLELHGMGLERMLDRIWEAGEQGQTIIDRHLAQDKLVSNLLILHGLHPLPLETRVMQALDKVRPYLQSHKGNVELVNISEGVVRLRLRGSCEGCAASAMTLKFAIEEAISEVAPDVVAVEAEGITPQAKPAFNFIPLDQLTGGGSNGNNETKWQEVRNLTSLNQGVVHTQQVSGQPVLFCRMGDDFYAYHNICPDCNQPLEQARLERTSLICPTCNHSYDVIRAGRGIDKPDVQLSPYPLLVEQGQVKIALPG